MLEIVPDFKKDIFIKRTKAPLVGISVCSWEHLPLLTPSAMNSHGRLITKETQPATEKMTCIS